MLKRKILTTSLLFLIFTLVPAFSGDHPTREEVEKFVKEAKAYALKYGTEKFLSEIIDPKGLFIRGELYIAAYSNDTIVLAHGAKPYLVGKDLSNLKDKKGLNLAEAYNNAIENGNGWIEYYWENPVTKKIQKKLGYALRVDETYSIHSGTYADE